MKVKFGGSFWVLPVLVAVALLALAACGGDDEEVGGPSPSPTAVTTPAPKTPTAVEFDVTITDGNGDELTFDEPPGRVVALAPSFVEIFCAVDACDVLVAVDENSNYPPEVESIAKLSGFDPSVEAIVASEPDLVVLSFDPGGLQDALEGLGIPVLFLESPRSLAEVYDQIALLGDVVGKRVQAAAVVADMQGRVGTVTSLLPAGGGPSVYHELDSTLFSVGPGSFIGDLYDVLGAANIANATGSAFPQLSNEAIIEANPEVIILGDEGLGETVESVAARPGWDTISAVQTGRIHGIDPDLISRPGPRIVDALEDLAKFLYPEIFE
ncbi:MAG: ABC transporter substrate-binding protein [Dehalococcoidia bacterium]